MKRSHWILMLLCCLIPLAGIAAIVVFHIPATSVLYLGLVLMCPVLHLAMMGSMRHDHAAPVGDVRPRPAPACHEATDEKVDAVAGTAGGAR